MLEAILISLAAVAAGTLLGHSLKMVRGENWRNSIRGMLFATALIAIALYLVVSRLKN
jgi:hypothetical protein